MKNPAAEFGEFVRQTRLRNGITARVAAENSGWLPSNFSKLEHGILTPPKNAERQAEIARAIGIVSGTDAETKFWDLAAAATESVPVDIAKIISREEALPLLLRTIGNKRLTEADIERLIEIVRGTDARDNSQVSRRTGNAATPDGKTARACHR